MINGCVVNGNYNFPFSTPSIFSEYAKKFTEIMNDLTKELQLVKLKAEAEKRTIEILNDLNYCIAEMQTYRDLMQSYYINDLKLEEDIFTDLCMYFDDMLDKVEVLQEKDLSNYPDGLKNIIVKKVDTLYEQVVMAKFEASQKIAEQMIGCQED